VHLQPKRIGLRALLGGSLASAALLGAGATASADIQMGVPVVGQQDGRWGTAGLGTSPVDTIASAGCAITAVDMMLAYYGLSSDPGMLNAWLTANGGYEFDDYIEWAQVAPASEGRIVFTGWFGPDLNLINSELDDGHPVIAEVVLNRSKHFVLLTGYGPAGYIANDPWYADRINFSDRYGDPSSAIGSIRTFAPRPGSALRGAGTLQPNGSSAPHPSQ
jgi:hypothetical protein